MTLGLVPKILNTVYVITATSKQLAVIYAKMLEFTDIKRIITVKNICIKNAVRHYLLSNYGQQGATFYISDNNCVKLVIAL